VAGVQRPGAGDLSGPEPGDCARARVRRAFQLISEIDQHSAVLRKFVSGAPFALTLSSLPVSRPQDNKATQRLLVFGQDSPWGRKPPCGKPGPVKVQFEPAVFIVLWETKFPEPIPILYLKGISTGDFEEALGALLGKDAGGLSASTIARLR
jgi:hypothetical protein